MITATLVISCLLSLGLGVLGSTVVRLLRISLEVRGAELARLREDLTLLRAESSAQRLELDEVLTRGRKHELDLSTLALKAGVRRAE